MYKMFGLRPKGNMFGKTCLIYQEWKEKFALLVIVV